MERENVLSSMVLEDGHNNLDLFHLWVSEDVVRLIIGIPPPQSEVGLYGITWARSSNGSFSIKSAFWKIREETWNPKNDIWKLLLKFQGLQRFRYFIWLVLKEHLLTNSERAKRGLGLNGYCGLCDNECEDILHAIVTVLLLRILGKRLFQ
ncbi:uncharacterized protein LOC108462805 [Gossypium arboreum]|uniref:uncharacterized protein LOC108462805 n=1 Tax=Gossypium arboreum TaxID=29729 RepID=UPI000818F62A|nr:uncharacterized protein LOC108462805 [Gossypium arboreum]